MQHTPAISARKGLLEWALSLVFPRRCLACDAALGGEWEGASPARFARPSVSVPEHLCAQCEELIDYGEKAVCLKCGCILGPHAEPVEQCSSCQGRDLPFRRAVAVARYDGPMLELIHQLKFSKRIDVAPILGDMLAKKVAAEGFATEVEMVVPVPLHFWRWLWRGFNQSELIARAVARALGRPLCARVLRRSKRTPPQSQLGRAERLANPGGAFHARRPKRVKGRTVLLVDDVLTTGATAAEAARALKQAGAKTVYVATVAR